MPQASGIIHCLGQAVCKCVFVDDVGGSILLFIHYLLSSCSRLGSLSGALQTVKKQGPCSQEAPNSEGERAERKRTLENDSEMVHMKQPC